MDANGNRVVSDGTKDGLCCWKYPRVCDAETVATFAMPLSVAKTLTGAFKITGDDTCYHFSADDAPTCVEPGTVKTSGDVATTYDTGCYECQTLPCADVPDVCFDNYRTGLPGPDELSTTGYVSGSGCSYTTWTVVWDDGSPALITSFSYDGTGGRWVIESGGGHYDYSTGVSDRLPPPGAVFVSREGSFDYFTLVSYGDCS